MIKKIYNFIFAPPFDGFGPLIVNVTLLLFISNIAIGLGPKWAFYIGLMSYPLLVFMRKKCQSLSNWPERQ